MAKTSQLLLPPASRIYALVSAVQLLNGDGETEQEKRTRNVACTGLPE